MIAVFLIIWAVTMSVLIICELAAVNTALVSAYLACLYIFLCFLLIIDFLLEVFA